MHTPHLYVIPLTYSPLSYTPVPLINSLNDTLNHSLKSAHVPSLSRPPFTLLNRCHISLIRSLNPSHSSPVSHPNGYLSEVDPHCPLVGILERVSFLEFEEGGHCAIL